ncbi:D-alanyl-D-alanine carboxypeptidase/D-alanyl-D-alanine-endopeptidase [Thalassococcus sp. S3]|uniref:D-alanyl-D-alanine carboxypeptidase/D-alanyl-D-alanine endopeptidase n=1 Tax=Thalassococcus sp. S3 TaxID=2017482 RepID=UPI0010241F1B|nr:D-alanyl-D-alanine carboxypeptidase/D-alanyl-D-alanine-endopeptidase [Thalassococcus sp. S3]QBF30288.1 D-alanyl-D-alanine carboxypeptidase/D-alanyl-D-alanine-endopeptidase [Thalassococcus sp. S3]
MRNRVSRRLVLSGLSAFIAAPAALAGAPERSIRPQKRLVGLRKRAIGGPERLIAASGLSGEVSFAVADVKSGLRLEGHDEAKGQPPASVTKAITALYALDALGAEHRFSTRLLAAGSVSNGVLSGDLILAGGGDPTLDTDDLANMARALKEAGVREVRGTFRVYEGALPFVPTIDAGQPDHVGYSPAVTGIALNFNRVHFEWKRAQGGYSVAMDARTERYRPEVAMARMRIAGRDLPVYTYADQNGVDTWTVARGALGNGGARWLPVRRPADYAGDVFRTFARSHGIVLDKARVSRALPAGSTVLVQHRSEPLRVILKDMLRFSNNLTAEMVGMSASVAMGRKPGSLKASAQAMSRWAGQSLGMTSASLVDHSGLGDASRMSASELVTALVQVRKRGILRPILKPFTLRDDQGRVIRNHPIKVDAKTGTLNFVSGLGGFMTAADGTELAFAIFTADTAIRSRIKRADRERPPGARTWNRRSKKLQQKLIERWGALYGS